MSMAMRMARTAAIIPIAVAGAGWPAAAVPRLGSRSATAASGGRSAGPRREPPVGRPPRTAPPLSSDRCPARPRPLRRDRRARPGPGVPPPTPGPTVPSAARRGWTSTGTSIAAASRSTAGASTSSSSATGDRTIVFVHGLAGSWQNWLENLPVLAAAATASSPSTSRASASRSCPRTRSRSPATAGSSTRSSTASASGRRSSSATRWAASSAAEVAIQFPARVDRLVLVSAAGLTVEYQRNDRLLGALQYGQRLLTAWGGFIGARSDAIARRPDPPPADAARRGVPREAAGPADLRAGARRRASPASSTPSTR